MLGLFYHQTLFFTFSCRSWFAIRLWCHKSFSDWDPWSGRCRRVEHECTYHCSGVPASASCSCVATPPWRLTSSREETLCHIAASLWKRWASWCYCNALDILGAQTCSKQTALHYKTILCPKKKVNKFRIAEVSRGQKNTTM